MADGTDPSTSSTSERRREAVATNAGLSAIHGGSEKSKVVWRGPCDAEADMFISVERLVDSETARTVTDLPIECPICGDEHLLKQTS